MTLESADSCRKRGPTRNLQSKRIDGFRNLTCEIADLRNLGSRFPYRNHSIKRGKEHTHKRTVYRHTDFAAAAPVAAVAVVT